MASGNYSQEADTAAIFLSGALVFGLLWHYTRYFSQILPRTLFDVVVFLAISSVLLSVIALVLKQRQIKRGQLKPTQWARMSGRQFEDQVVLWLKLQGYSAVTKTEYYDRGIDILAVKDSQTYGIQVKRSNRPVGVSAVRAAVTGLKSYGCDAAMVITNADFTNQAQRLARDNACRLINGDALLKKINHPPKP